MTARSERGVEKDATRVACPYCLEPAGSPCVRVNSRRGEIFSTGMPAKQTHLARHEATRATPPGATS